MSGSHAILKVISALCCWVTALFLIVGGIALLASANGLTDHLSGVVVLAGGLFVMPPVLVRLRSRIFWARPAWVPVAVAFAALPVAAIIGHSYKPPDGAGVRLPVRTNVVEVQSGEFQKAIASRSPEAVEKTPQDPASVYAERLTSYWLPQARALPTVPPSDDPAFGALLTEIDGLVTDIDDGSSLSLSAAQRAQRAELMAVLSDKQARLLPALRQKYARELDIKFFRDDIRVSAEGSTLTLVGAAFVRNANIDDMQIALTPVVARLRFHRIVYRWSRYFNDGLHYDLTPPDDQEIAQWNGSQFIAVGG